MEIRIFQVDAFAERVFQGNPAAVCPLDNWLPDAQLQAIAAENNLSETAFFVPDTTGYHLRWFTPEAEVRLCGHATLATAHVLFHHLHAQEPVLLFHTLSGVLRVQRDGAFLQMTFPVDIPQEASLPDYLEEALGVEILDIKMGIDDYLVRIASEAQLKQLQPDLTQIRKLGARGLIVTAPGTETDIASRCFFPNLGVDEDPVTGSAHTLLTPYWAAITGKKTFYAVQGGQRIGYLHCTVDQEHVILSGKAKTFLIGSIFLES